MDQKFPDKLHFDDAGMKGGSRLLMITAPFRFRSPLGIITVPSGFVTDGASVPRIFWNIFSPFGSYFRAAVIHDYLYSPLNAKFNRKQSDGIFLDGMRELGVGWLKRKMIYRAVRMFGMRSFKSPVK